MSSLKECVSQSTKSIIEWSDRVVSDQNGEPSSMRVVLVWAMALFTWYTFVWSWMCFTTSKYIQLDFGPITALVAAVMGKTVQSFAEHRSWRDRDNKAEE